MRETKGYFAVLTGDLVKSSEMTAEQSITAMEHLRQLAQEFEFIYPSTTIGGVDTFRHDSWQWLLAKPELALRAALFIRTGLRLHSADKTKLDTRIAIGVGTVERIADQRISDSRGLAFTLSGKTLDSMKNNRMAYALAEKVAPVEVCLTEAVVPLLDCIASGWTITESRAIYGALLGLTQEETANSLPVSKKTDKRPTRQAISKALARAHWGVIEKVLIWYESDRKQPAKVANA